MDKQHAAETQSAAEQEPHELCESVQPCATLAEVATALAHVNVPLLLVREDGQILHSTATAARFFKLNAQSITDQTLNALLEVDQFSDLINSKGAVKAEWHVEAVPLRKSDGDIGYVTLHISLGQTLKQGHYYSVGLCDVTEQERKVTGLESTKARWQHALESAEIGVFEVDLATGKSIVSDTWRAIMGLEGMSVEDAQNEWLARIHPEDLKIVQAADQACIEGHNQRSIANFRMRGVDNTRWRWMCSNAFVRSRDANGKALNLSGTQTDITHAVETEKELRRSEEQFRSSFEYGPIGVAIVGLTGTWERVNSALCKMFGYDEATLLSTDFQSLTHPEDLGRDLELLNKLLANEVSSYQIEKRYIRADGSTIWGLLSVGLVRDSSGTPEHFISQIVDITEERKLAELKSEFVATVSHELRTPLTSVLGALRLVSAQYGDSMPEAARGLLNIAQQNGDRLHNLISDILDYEKLSAGEFSIEPSDQVLGSLIDDALLSNLPLAGANSVQIVSSCFDPKHSIQLDEKRFHQIATNLLSNAAKFAFTGSVIKFDAAKDGGRVRFSVTNQGDGIPEDFKSQIFKPFSQAASTSIRKHGGTGLGLSITKKIVEKMGGEIGFESVQNKQTTFWFTLPLNV